MLLFILSWNGNKASYCTSSNGGMYDGSKGLVRHQDGSKKEDARTDAHYSSDDNGPVFSLAGSYCATSSKEYKFTVHGKPAIRLTVGGTTDTNEGNDCVGQDLTVSVTKYLNAHECIAIAGEVRSHWSGFCRNPDFEIRANGAKASSNDIINCDKGNSGQCRWDYTGPNCQYYVTESTYDCNGHGNVRRGKRSDYIGCVCSSYDGNRFCEDTGSYHYSSSKQLTTTTTNIAGSGTSTSSQDILKIDSSNYNPFYSKIKQVGKIYVPQNTDLEFKLVSNPEAHIKISSGSTTMVELGSLSDPLLCDPYQQETTLTSSKKYFSKGEYKIEIEYNSGCQFMTPKFSLQWKFYIWYGNSPSWEDIPVRYVGH